MTTPHQTLWMDEEGRVGVSADCTLLDIKRLMRAADTSADAWRCHGGMPKARIRCVESEARAAALAALEKANITEGPTYHPGGGGYLVLVNLLEASNRKNADTMLAVLVPIITTAPDVILAYIICHLKDGTLESRAKGEQRPDGSLGVSLTADDRFDERGMWRATP